MLRLDWIVLVVVLTLAIAERACGQIALPDIIIGDLNEPENDILGPPISAKEVELSLRSLDENEDEPKDDPITSPSNKYFEGDIVLASEDQLYQLLEGDPDGQLSAIRNNLMTWPQGTIPYVISNAFSSTERGVIGRAMQEFAAKTCIRFVPRASHRDYIHILKGQGCSSAVGRNGGVQVVSLGNGCVVFGVVVHELMHAAGFWHEQSRSDRDSYVTINWGNILPGLAYNFEKKSTSVTTDLGLPYDYNSIMHYGPYAFTRTYGVPTITPKRSGVTIGQRKELSQLDIKGLNLLYRCSGVGPTPKPTPPPRPGRTCSDDHVYCPSWARAGHCTSNKPYMSIYCKKSCHLCSNECQDLVTYCASWAERGECQRNRNYMSKRCSRACGFCKPDTCQDQNEHCEDWARKGECKENPGYMNVQCAKSCRTC